MKLLQYKNEDGMVTAITCRNDSLDCFYGSCPQCKDRVSLGKMSDVEDVNTWYHKWMTQLVERPGAKNKVYKVDIVSRVRIECSVNQLALEFEKESPVYLKHVYNARHQHKAVRNTRENLSENQVLVVNDFSANYLGESAEETHDTHFGASKKQISLHTGVLYYKDCESGEIVCKTFCTRSESCRHDPPALWAHLEPVITLIRDYVPDVDEFHFQSDGPTTQYRNKSNFYFFHEFYRSSKLKFATWNLTAPGHGKSTADGVDGTVKSMCDRHVANSD
ncbi:hypothetical protein QAD02_002165 [Eretmocerus hayati]|uniref:Uncharacterized protein n=1 Tax=Eretmocerus hayati TaxID=131215 RepID=A0ACC2NJ13_9HYME|nr:hypothetical protein QAD02_002165 [Eretmocerus hayati]